MAKTYDDAKFEFAEWLLTPDTERVADGKPSGMRGLAKHWRVSEATLRRWKRAADFPTVLYQARVYRERSGKPCRDLTETETVTAVAVPSPVETAAESVSVADYGTPELDNDELFAALEEYSSGNPVFDATVKALARKAIAGDLNTAKYLMQTVFASELSSISDAEYNTYSDEELEEELLTTVSDSTIVKYLTTKGYSITKEQQ